MRRRGVLYRSLVVLAGILALVALPATSSATLAPTPGPYMGWNTYYQVGSETPGSNNITESTIKSVAGSLVSTGLAKAGYTIVWLDFGWASGARDSNNSLILDATQWPNGLSALTSHLHGPVERELISDPLAQDSAARESEDRPRQRQPGNSIRLHLNVSLPTVSSSGPEDSDTNVERHQDAAG